MRITWDQSKFPPELGVCHTFLSHMERHEPLNKLRAPIVRKKGITAQASHCLGSNPGSATFPLGLSFLICKMDIVMGPGSQDCCENKMNGCMQTQLSTSLSYYYLSFGLLPKVGPRRSILTHRLDCRRLFLVYLSPIENGKLLKMTHLKNAP